MTPNVEGLAMDAAMAGAFRAELRKSFLINRRLPERPFDMTSGHTLVCEFDRTFEDTFGNLIGCLMAHYGDDRIIVAALSPDSSYFLRAYGYYPIFSLQRDLVSERYVNVVWHEPGGDATGALAVSTEVFAVTGTSHAWAYWAQRDWELGVLWTATMSRDWEGQGPALLSPKRAIDEFGGPPGWSRPLNEAEVDAFIRNLT